MARICVQKKKKDVCCCIATAQTGSLSVLPPFYGEQVVPKKCIQEYRELLWLNQNLYFQGIPCDNPLNYKDIILAMLRG